MKNNTEKNIAQPAELTVKEIVDRIITSGKMSRQDYMILTSVITKNGDFNDAARRMINRIFDYIQTGRLKLVDW